MQVEKLLETITLDTGRVFVGIVELITKKHVYMFDFSKSPKEYIELAILWKGNHPDLRFSVYCSIEHPGIILPKTVLIPVSSIRDSTKIIEENKIPKYKKKSI